MWIAVVVWTIAWLFLSRWFWDYIYYIKYHMYRSKCIDLEKEVKRLEEQLKKSKQAQWMYRRQYELTVQRAKQR